MSSDIGVKPRMSEKKMTTGRFVPPSVRRLPAGAICDAELGAK